MTTQQHTDPDICDLCEYTRCATVICETCMLQYCDSCFQSHHPMRGTLDDHLVTRTTADLADEKCPLHNERYLHFCITCNSRVCPHCLILPTVSTSSRWILTERHPHIHHEILTVEQYIDKQKKAQSELPNKDSVLDVFQESLLQQIDTVSHVLEAADFGGDAVEDRKMLLELTWLSYKEKVRQEFVSIHDLLIEREQELLRKMQTRVEIALDSMTSLGRLQETFEEQETLLTEENIKLVQDKSRVRFMKGYKDIAQRCEELTDNIRLLPQLDDVTPTFLKMPFSLIEEKLHLSNSLKFEAYEKTSVIPRSRITYFQTPDLSKPVRCLDLWDPPKYIPASTSCVYNIEVTSKSGSKVIKYTDVQIDDFVFNSAGRVSLHPSMKYILKVVPVYRCYVGGGAQEAIDGVPLCMMVITDQPPALNGLEKRRPLMSKHKLNKKPYVNDPSSDVRMTDTPEGRFHVKNEFLLHSSFEEDRLNRQNGAEDTGTTGDGTGAAFSDTTENSGSGDPTAEVNRNTESGIPVLGPGAFAGFRFKDSTEEAERPVTPTPDSFLLDDTRYQTKECFLSHYSFEESRFDYLESLFPSQQTESPV